MLLLLLLNEVWQAKVTRFMQPPSVLLSRVLTSSASSSHPQSTHQALLGNHLHAQHTSAQEEATTTKQKIRHGKASFCSCTQNTSDTTTKEESRGGGKACTGQWNNDLFGSKSTRPQAKKRDCSTQCSQVVSNPGTDRARRDLTSLIRREVVLSSWCGRNQTNKASQSIKHNHL